MTEITQLIYVSRRTPTLEQKVLEEIIRTSRNRNQVRDVSGVLMCCGENIIQLLEGEPQTVEALFARISADPRHTNVECVLRKSVKKRLFPEWGMGLADLQSSAVLNRDRLIRLIEDIRATNDTLHYGVEARVLLNDFRQQLSRAA